MEGSEEVWNGVELSLDELSGAELSGVCCDGELGGGRRSWGIREGGGFRSAPLGR
jgi:hypothetical protein